MFQIFFEYEETTKTYIYHEKKVDYLMSLPMMLKFKKHVRENGREEEFPIQNWFSTLDAAELKQIRIKEMSY